MDKQGNRVNNTATQGKGGLREENVMETKDGEDKW